MNRSLGFALMIVAVSTPQTFRTGAEAVSIDVLVLEHEGPVAGLTSGDFDLTDCGVRQTVTVAGMDDVPVSAMLVLDTSDSVQGGVLRRLQEAAQAAIAQMRRSDRVSVMTFSESLRLHVPWGTPSDAAVRRIGEVTANGNTALTDAVFSAMVMRDPLPGQRNLLLVFSDGDDTASWLPDSTVLEKGERTDVVIYSVVLRSDGVLSRPPRRLFFRSGVSSSEDGLMDRDKPLLAQLSAVSGGEYLEARTASDLHSHFAEILRDFRHRYVLTYRPEGVDQPGWHPVDVHVKNRRVTILARRGYTR